MKYHQLVPARAINALSDWLVFNLEELGVEAPLVYSRLLLSLLHTTFHVNTVEQAADIPYFKEFLTLNKNQQFDQLDTEELKRFAAVHILIDATTSTLTKDKENSTIIELVNELYNRIRDIEKENTSTCATSLSGTGGNCKSIAESARPTVLNGSSSSSSSASSSGNWSTTTSSSVNGGSSKGEQVEVVGGGTATRACNASTSNASNERNQSSSSAFASCSIEDLKKKYYSAFPALDNELGAGEQKSKQQLEVESLSVNNNNNNLQSHQSHHQKQQQQYLNQKNNNNLMASAPNTSQNRLSWSNVFSGTANLASGHSHTGKAVNSVTSTVTPMNVNKGNSASSSSSTSSSAINSLKRKPKRKRPVKTKSFYMKKQSSEADSLWDMNFEGSWEMGRDLIHEFVTNTSSSKRNRSISEGDAYGKMDDEDECCSSLDVHHGASYHGRNNRHHSGGGGAAHHHRHNTGAGTRYRHKRKTLSFNNNDGSIIDFYTTEGITAVNDEHDKCDHMVSAEESNCKYDSAATLDAATTLASLFSHHAKQQAAEAKIQNATETHNEINARQTEQLYIADMKAKFENIKLLWGDETSGTDTVDAGEDVVDSSCWGSGVDTSVWQPLQRPIEAPPIFGPGAAMPYENTYLEPQQLEVKVFVGNDNEFIKSGTNLQSSIWSNDGASETNSWADDASFSDALKCRQICDNYDKASDYSASYLSTVGSSLAPQPVQPEKCNSFVSLANHSETSMFTKVIASKKRSPVVVIQRDTNYTASCNESVDPSENLLVSERTHFKPIKKTYPDGFSFDISGNWDQVNYYRSETGSLFLDSDKYMELKWRNDDGDVIELDDASGAANDAAEVKKDKPTEKFVIKFSVADTEKGCQTDEMDYEEAEEVGWNTEFYFGTNWRYNEQILQDTRIDCIDASGDDDSKGLWDYDSNHGGTCLNNNNTHRVWEACPTCNDAQSFPANRRLKDELHADGEEILSDLNYFQSLIIGSNDWVDEPGGTEIENDNHDYTADNLIDRKVYHKVDKIVSNLLKPETTQTLAKALDTTCNWGTVAETELLPFAYLFNCSGIKSQQPVRFNDFDGDNGGSGGDSKTSTVSSGSTREAAVPPAAAPNLTDLNKNNCKTPPDKYLNAVEFLNWCNYIDAEMSYNDGKNAKPKNPLIPPLQELVNLQNAVRGSRMERKRRHSACRNVYNARQIKRLDDGFGIGLGLGFGGGGFGGDSDADFNETIADLKSFIKINEKHALPLADQPLIINEMFNLANETGYTLNAKYWPDASFILKNNNNLLLNQIEITRPLTR